MQTFRSAEILCVGTELLLGDIVNTNAAYLSRRLALLGIPVYRETVVGDNPARLRRAVADALSESNLLIVSGGLGPTYDDLTKETVAEYFGRPMLLNAESLARCEAYFARTGRAMPENNKKQAMMPEGAIVFPNDYGTAPALAIEDEARGLTAILLPGPPRELEPIFRERVEPYLRARSKEIFLSKNLHLFGIGESQAEEYVRELMEESRNPTVAPYCKTGEVRFRITARADDEARAGKMCDEMIARLQSTALAPYIYGIDVESLESAAVACLTEKHLTVSAAESLTGGMIGMRLTAVPGASAVYVGGCVTYTNEMKEALVGVSHETLEKHTAVSEAVAREMAIGIAQRTGSDFGLSATGIAGPGGGSEEIPVGTVFVGLAECMPDGTVRTEVRRLSLSPMRDRAYIRTLSASNAIEMLLRAAQKRRIANPDRAGR